LAYKLYKIHRKDLVLNGKNQMGVIRRSKNKTMGEETINQINKKN
jgi:hypothetical protein